VDVELSFLCCPRQIGVQRACRKLTHHPLARTRGVCEDTLILALADGQKTITVRHSKLMHHRLTEVPELLGTSHSAYETAVESFRTLVRVKMAPTRLEEYLGILRQSPQGDAGRSGVSVVHQARQLSRLNG